MKKLLYLDFTLEDWVENPSQEETLNLIKVYDISFSTHTEIKSVSSEDYAMGDDDVSRSHAALFGDPRTSQRLTYLVVHATFEWNGEAGCLSKTTDTLISTMTVKDDGRGNPINSELVCTGDEITKESILDLLKESIIAAIKSNQLELVERTYTQKSINILNNEFDLLI